MNRARARHILVSSESACLEFKQQIENGADFSALAQGHSNCPSGANGGDLGYFSPGMMVPEFDGVVFNAPLLQVQGPVRTEFGYHLVEVTERS